MNIFKKAMDADTPIPTIALVFGIGMIVAVIGFLVSYPLLAKGCHSAYSEYSPQYGLWSGCRIVWDGKLTPVDLVKNVTIEN